MASFNLQFTFPREPKILWRTIQCCLLNGGVFWTSMILFDRAILPLLEIMVDITLGDTGSSSGSVWFWIKTVLSWTFGALWVVPLFLLSKVVNSLWFLVRAIFLKLISNYLYFVSGYCSHCVSTLSWEITSHDKRVKNNSWYSFLSPSTSTISSSSFNRELPPYASRLSFIHPSHVHAVLPLLFWIQMGEHGLGVASKTNFHWKQLAIFCGIRVTASHFDFISW